MSTFTDEDLTILESLEFEIPCEHSGHEGRGATGPAEWSLLMSPVLECGCRPTSTNVLWCDMCKEHILSMWAVRCNTCKGLIDPTANVLWIESIR